MIHATVAAHSTASVYAQIRIRIPYMLRRRGGIKRVLVDAKGSTYYSSVAAQACVYATTTLKRHVTLHQREDPTGLYTVFDHPETRAGNFRQR